MKNKILSVALMAVAAICILCVPFAADKTDKDIPVVQPDVTQTTTVTTPEETSAEAAVTTVTTEEVTETTTEVTKPPEDVTTTAKKKTTTAQKTTTTTQKTTTATQKVTTAAPVTTPAPTTTAKVTTTAKATTTKAKTQAKKPAPAPNAEKGTPVANHGQLSVKGANIVDKNGKVFQIRGMSTHGLGWFPEAVSEESFRVLRDDWGCNTIRLAMYIEESWGGSESLYLAQPQKNMDLVTKGVDACSDLGLYVIVDWHVLNPGDPTTHTEDAKKFFSQIAQKYGSYPNIIYEICNEPNSGADWNKVKSYAEQVIPVIRKYDSDAIIICGTPTWSQDIDQAANNRLSDKNTVYALHFYANTHTQWLRDRVQQCYNNGLPILVSEFGTCDASGNGGFNVGETQNWFTLLDGLNIGYLNWSFCNKGETASAFQGGANLAAIQPGEGQLTDSGKIIRKHLRERAGLQ